MKRCKKNVSSIDRSPKCCLQTTLAEAPTALVVQPIQQFAFERYLGDWSTRAQRYFGDKIFAAHEAFRVLTVALQWLSD
jgi:lipocalin